MHDLTTSDTGQNTLSEITEYPWKDDGNRASKLFSWVPEWAASKTPEQQEAAGETAHAIAVFLADNSTKLLDTDSDEQNDDRTTAIGEINPDLVRSYTRAIIPFLAASVGDTGTSSAFQPLDPIEGSMPRTYEMFRVLGSDATSSRELGTAVVELADHYRSQVYEQLKGVPKSVDAVDTDVCRAARLLGLAIASKIQAPDSAPLIFNPEIAETELNYTLALASATPMNDDISAKYFRDGALIMPEKVRKEYGEAEWDEYSGMLSRYVARSDELRGFSSLFSQTLKAITSR